MHAPYGLPLLADGDIDGTTIALIVTAAVALIIVIFLMKYLNLYVRALFSRANISLFELVGMSFRKVNANLIVTTKVKMVQSGLTITTRELEAHYLAGGNVPAVVNALIAADRAGIDLPFNTAAAIDLAGRDVVEAIRTSVDPKVIDCPNPASGKSVISAVAKDGIELKAKGRVTVRTHIPRLIGGATEETIIARVGEGILTTIGSAVSHTEVLENPDRISQTVLDKGLDAGSAFEILSIDIADIDVGQNIGSQLQTHQAQADLLVAQAKAEERKAMAIAREHEMKAAVAENQAKVVLAEAEVPQAMAEAFRGGRLGIMDYMKIKNVEADTDMRNTLSKPPETE
ncbi:MAG: hypothetical protein CMJ83_17435 [Planctomycetes bacterium]|nr:hypothetical protein [Planctomycetota bacterium]